MHAQVLCNVSLRSTLTDLNVLVSGDRGPCSKYEISTPEGDFKGELEIVWDGEIFKVRGILHVDTYIHHYCIAATCIFVLCL